MGKKIFIILGLFFAIFGNFTVALAAPAQVVIIRHGDKWEDTPGNILSPTGYLRAVKFAEYYLKKFKKAPDFLFASNSTTAEPSLRPIQTLAPLAGHKELIENNVSINHQYTKGEEKQLVQAILNDAQYNGKSGVICWQHERIEEILSQFYGFKEEVVWNKYDYDTVYVLEFQDKKLIKATRLDKQYPVPNINDWKYFLKK